MAAYPGFSAIPGSVQPGMIWPGDAALGLPGPAAVFTIGTACFQWETEEPYLS